MGLQKKFVSYIDVFVLGSDYRGGEVLGEGDRLVFDVGIVFFWLNK